MDPKDKTDGARWETEVENLYGTEEPGIEQEEQEEEDDE